MGQKYTLAVGCGRAIRVPVAACARGGQIARPNEGDGNEHDDYRGQVASRIGSIGVERYRSFPARPHHVAMKCLPIGVQNGRGEVYRVIKSFGMKAFSDLIWKFRELGFSEEFAEEHGDMGGFDAVVRGPGKP